MRPEYRDLTRQLDPPRWWDGRGVPRDVSFHPDRCGGDHDSVTSMEILCQGYQGRFLVALPAPLPDVPAPMALAPLPPLAFGTCDVCGALLPWSRLLPLGQVDFVLDTPDGRQLVGSRPLRCCPAPWRHDPALHRDALEGAPLSLTRTGRFTPRPCLIRPRDLIGHDGPRPPRPRRRGGHRHRRRRAAGPFSTPSPETMP